MGRWKGAPPDLGNAEQAHLLARADALARKKVTLDESELLRALVDIGTHTWKAKVRLARADATAVPDIVRLARHVDGILESLQRLGLEIKDHTGETYDYGQSLKVAASQTKQGIDREYVSETIRPTIYLKTHMLQAGEVVIDIPEKIKE